MPTSAPDKKKRSSSKSKTKRDPSGSSKDRKKKEQQCQAQQQEQEPKKGKNKCEAEFARNGGVDAKDFQRMWRDRQNTNQLSPSGPTGGGVLNTVTAAGRRDGEGRHGTDGGVGGGGIGADKIFEFGQLFQEYDTDGDGRLGRADFERMIGGMLKRANPPTATTSPPPPAVMSVLGPSVSHYDETTGVPLTREAVTSQQSLGHTVVLLSEAYNRRLSRVQTLASSRLMPVREQLLQLRRRFYNRAEEVKAAKAAVERETMADAGAIAERLRSVEALKQATLSQGINDVTAELEGVEKIVEQVNGVTSTSTGAGFASPSTGHTHDFQATSRMVELIQTYPELCKSIDRVASKPLDTSIPARADDFPHETAERLEVLRRADRYEQALAVKDHMLWTALQDSRGLQDKVREEHDLGNEFADEAQEWVKLAGRLADDVTALKLETARMAQLREENAQLVRENQELVRRLKDHEGRRVADV